MKISASKTVFMPIYNVGMNHLPYVEDLRDRVIKYIDIVAMDSVPYDSAAVGFTSMDGYITLADKIGNGYPYYNIPLKKFNPEANLGQRPIINRCLSVQNSYLHVNSAEDIGKTAVLVFYYDIDTFSAADSSFDLNVDYIETMISSEHGKNLMPDLRALAGKRFRSISFAAPTSTPSGNPGVTADEGRNVYVSLYKGNYAVLDLIPLPVLQDITFIDSLQLKNIVFDLTNSFVVVGGEANLTGASVFLNVTYEH